MLSRTRLNECITLIMLIINFLHSISKKKKLFYIKKKKKTTFFLNPVKITNKPTLKKQRNNINI